MDNSKNETTSNVLSLFAKTRSGKESNAIDENSKSSDVNSCSFEETIRKNAENAKRMKDSRVKANQSVIRSYRLKT